MNARPSTPTHILWHSAELRSCERFVDNPSGDGRRFAGDLVLPVGDEPARISYEIDLDADWRTRRVDTDIDLPGGRTNLELTADGEGHWVRSGRPAPELDGCIDIDLGFTPATNTLPIRRLGLAEGESRTVVVAWLVFPELVLRRDQQRYTRLGDRRWRYASDGFVAELTVDGEGHVLRYGDGLWAAVAGSGS